MQLVVYTLKSCDTCKKAIAALTQNGHQISLVDVRADGVEVADLERFLSALGPDVLINRRSTTWRNLDEGARAGDPVTLLREYPTLMKRPVIDTGDTLYAGWAPNVQAALA